MSLDKSIQKCILNAYFPEVWYALDNWLALCKGKQILELGSGQGIFSVALFKAGWKVSSIDNCEFSVVATKARLKKEGFPESCHLIKSNSLPFPDRSFDGIVCTNYLEFQAYPIEIVKEISRVLKPAGRVVFTTLAGSLPWMTQKVLVGLRPGHTSKKPKIINKKSINELFSGTDLRVEQIHKLAKYLPYQFSDKPLPWISHGAHTIFCKKNEFGNDVNFDSTQINH